MSQFYEKHIFVCENIRQGENARVSCGKQNSKKIREYLKQKVKEIAPEQKIRVNMSGCLDRCELGPVSVSYPDGNWFVLKSESDVERLVEHFIQNNNPSQIKDILINEEE